MKSGAGFKEFVEDQLSGLRGVVCRPMFGGYGIAKVPGDVLEDPDELVVWAQEALHPGRLMVEGR